MTDFKHRVIAWDKDGKELDWWPYEPGLLDRILVPGGAACSVTIERLPPEEAEPRRVWVNRYPTHYGPVYPTKERANEEAGNGRTACVQFIEAKITDSQLTRLREKLAEQGWTMAGQATNTELRAALNAAWRIEE